MTVELFNLAARHNDWLTQRQVLVASNVANVDTPGYRAVRVAPFSEVLDTTGREVAVTNARHMSAPVQATAGDPGDEEGTFTKHSGNTVSIENELLEAQQVRRAFSLNTAIIKTFHGLTIAATKG